MAKAPYVFPLIGGKKISHLHDNIAALELKLSTAEIEAIEAVKPFAVGFPHDFIGPDPGVTGQIGPILGGTGTIEFVKKEQALGHE